jgi:hypothetical protein
MSEDDRRGDPRPPAGPDIIAVPPVTTKDGGAITLRAASQPGRYLVARNGGAYFDQVPVDQATAFVVQPAM